MYYMLQILPAPHTSHPVLLPNASTNIQYELRLRADTCAPAETVPNFPYTLFLS